MKTLSKAQVYKVKYLNRMLKLHSTALMAHSNELTKVLSKVYSGPIDFSIRSNSINVVIDGNIYTIEEILENCSEQTNTGSGH